jgi:hypothetical protein
MSDSDNLNYYLNYKELAEYPLGDDDLRKILGDKISIIAYPDLEKVEYIDDIFDEFGRCILLLLTLNDHSGHWLALHKDGDHIHFFDPYGETISAEKKWIGKEKLKQLGQDKPLLMNLLKNSGLKVYYNAYPFQIDKTDINTCGRHCCVRLLYKNLNLDEYYNLIQETNITPDEFVTNITYEILKK